MHMKEEENINLFEVCDKLFAHINGSPNEELQCYIEKIKERENLTKQEAKKAMEIIMSDHATDYQKGAFLTAMKIKEPTAQEISSFAVTLREMAEPVNINFKVGTNQSVTLGDTCGTGGGTLETFNVSTTIVFILASAGMVIAKHGNRAITSKCGSADVLEALGVKIDLEPSLVGKCISEINIGFIYAPNFHKAFKNIQHVRKQLPFQTVFNFLGPLANPAFKVASANQVQVLGVYNKEFTEIIAEVLSLLKLKRAIVVHGLSADNGKGMDELSSLGKSKVSELSENGDIINYYVTPEQFDIKRAKSKDLVGGYPDENAKTLKGILSGEIKGPKADLALLNAAAGLYVGNMVDTIKEGIKLAQSTIQNKSALRKLEDLIEYTTSANFRIKDKLT